MKKNTMLWSVHVEAALNGDLESLKLSVTTENVNQLFNVPVANSHNGVVTDYNVTLLYLAAQNGHTGTVQWLKTQGADINVLGINDMTPLFTAIFHKHPETAAALIEIGARGDIPNCFGFFPMHFAALHGDLEILKSLVTTINVNRSAGEEDGCYATPVYLAAQNGHTEMVQWLKTQGAEIDLRGAKGMTPLFTAIFHKHPETAAALIELGAKVNIPNCFGFFPMHFAALYGDLETLKLLVTDHNVDQSTGEEAGCYATPVYLAAQNGHTAMVQWLKTQGAEINLRGAKGMTPLMTAIAHGHTETAAALIDLGAKVNIPNCFGFFPIHCAAGIGDLETVTRLDSISDVNIPAVNSIQQLPIHNAFSKARTEVIEYLLSKGASINAQTIEGKTPLHLLLANQDIEIDTKLQIVQRYLNEFDLSIKDKLDKTAFDYAQEYYPDCIGLSATFAVAAILAQPQLNSETAAAESEAQEESITIVEELMPIATPEMQESAILGEGPESIDPPQ